MTIDQPSSLLNIYKNAKSGDILDLRDLSMVCRSINRVGKGITGMIREVL